MSNTVIKVENLGKKYVIGHQKQERYSTFRDILAQKGRALSARLLHPLSPNRAKVDMEEFWALKNINFEIKQGDRLGIIGRNGAGKSTLLKILSRITDPTVGRIHIKGRVASLLEVGTGFHPELTGRENIYLNGAILGMTRVEIRRKFDEIVDFAGLEKFLDTPVKRYSSGMYVRLAFAVAAHLEPEILVVDEVLAVGDVAFQKKCLGKMGEVAKGGRTVLFVSHQMNSIKTLCSRCLWISEGEIVKDGPSQEVVENYLKRDDVKTQWISNQGKSQLTNPYFNPLKMSLVDINGEIISRNIAADEKFGILIEGESEVINIALTVGFAIYRTSGELLFWSLHTDKNESEWPKIQKGKNKLVAWIPNHFLNEGDYILELILSLHFKEWLSQPLVNSPSIQFSIRGGLSDSPYWMMARPGLLAPVLDFEKY
jgi:lipopolysaccharide transport system ATP-binding protein